MYQWLSEAIENDSLVITASRRLTRVLKSEYDKQQLANGHRAWLSPNIRFLDDWLTSIVDCTPESLPILLNGHAAGIVWERCLKEHASEALLNIGGLIGQAKKSWQRLNDWQVPLRDISAAARSQDELLFIAAARKYRAILADNNWIDGAQMPALVTELVKKRIVDAPPGLIYAGFDRLVPAVKHFFAVLVDMGCEVSAAQSNAPGIDIAVAAFRDRQAELRAAGAWARHELAKEPDLNIGIVSSTLNKDGAASERLIREGVAPGWQYGGTEFRKAVNTSYGRRLSEYPAISSALLILQWVYRDLSFADISLLLRTQTIVGQETVGRCKLELYLRRLPDRPWTPSALIRLFSSLEIDADAANWLEAVEILASFEALASEKESPAIWAEKIDGLLGTIGWPGKKTLASDEFQLLNRWRDLLNDLARLAIVCPVMTFAEASSRLGAMANDAIYQPESESAVVQLLGPLEAAGMRFDRLWVSGLDAESWPPGSHPLALISRQLQRQYGMPDSTPEDTLEYSRRVLNRILSSAGQVRLSWPQSGEESENTATRLIRDYAELGAEQIVDPGWHAKNLIGNRLARPTADSVPATGEDELVAGGAYTVQRQVTNPFSAYAYGRLRVSEIDPVTTGLSPSQRGVLVHKALHSLLAEAPSQDAIRQWSNSETVQRINIAVDSALRIYLWQADPVLRRLIELERIRLCDLLKKFLKAELSRRPFTIQSVEREIEYEQFGARLNLRIDRIDRLSDGSLLIADYKTGQPKNLLRRNGDARALQLVVYACAIEETIGGLVLINIDSRTILYKGASASGEWDAKGADLWPERIGAWKKSVAGAMQQIANGDVRLNLNLPLEDTRSLNILSRIEELRRGQ